MWSPPFPGPFVFVNKGEHLILVFLCKAHLEHRKSVFLIG